MARAPDPRVEQAHDLHKQGMMLVEIASQLNIPVGTIRSWKKRYEWECNATQEKKCNVAKGKKNKDVKKEVFDDGTKETMLNENLTHEQRLFCIYYSKIFNATQAYINAYKCDYETANANGSRLLVNASVRAEIQRLKEIKRQQIVSGTDDLVDLHMRIAFADIGNYLSFKQEQQQVIGQFGPIEIKDDNGDKKPLMQDVNVIRLNDSHNVDTQLIQEVKQGKDGVSIKLADKQKSLDWLSKYFLSNPTDKRIYEYDCKERELRIEKAQLDIKSQTGDNKDNEGIQEFLKATKPSKEDIEALYKDEVSEHEEKEE